MIVAMLELFFHVSFVVFIHFYGFCIFERKKMIEKEQEFYSMLEMELEEKCERTCCWRESSISFDFILV